MVLASKVSVILVSVSVIAEQNSQHKERFSTLLGLKGSEEEINSINHLQTNVKRDSVHEKHVSRHR